MIIRTMRLRRQPMASKIPISWVRSKTLMSIVFITPTAPTTSAMSEVAQLIALAAWMPVLFWATSPPVKALNPG